MSEAAAEAKPSAPKSSSLPMLLALVNVVAMLAAMGVLLYTKVLYKRPPITEDAERARVEKDLTTPHPAAEAALVSFDPVTVNIAASPAAAPPGAAARQSIGKLHYATIGFTLEIRDESGRQDVETVKALIMDKFIGILGRRQFHEINNVQGRYVLRTQLLEIANQVISESAGRIQPAALAAPAAGEAKGGGEGEGGGEGHEEKKAEAPAAPARGIANAGERDEDPVTNVFFTQFIIQ